MLPKVIALLITLFHARLSSADIGDPFTLINKVQTKCELLAITSGTKLADAYNNYDENTEYDSRVHNDYNTEYLGFAAWMGSGTWGSNGITAEKNNAKELQKRGGWISSQNVSQSAFWGFENQWVYMMGDSTARQVWATFVSPFQSNNFERNAKEWTRENCKRQYPHRKQHPSGWHFPEEGWGGKCGNNEVTCDLSGFGPEGKFTFDWKHFPYEDYDEWLFGEAGVWNTTSDRKPDIIAIQTGLHTCFHSHVPGSPVNTSMVEKHEADISKLMNAVQTSLIRSGKLNTIVIFITSGRYGYSAEHHAADQCIWKFNRLVVQEAHKRGYAVLEREEIERRYLYKGLSKPAMHLDAPGPQIIGTSLLALISCLRRNGTAPRINDVF